MNLKDLTAYEIIEEKELPDIHSNGCLLRHKKAARKLR